MTDNDTVEVAAGVWDSLSTGKRAVLSIAAITLLIASAGVGYTFRGIQEQNVIARLEAIHERQITDLNRKLAEQQEPIKYALRLVPHDEGLPELDDAPFDGMSLNELLRKQADFDSRLQGKTEIQRPNFFQQYVGRRFQWEGKVLDVSGGHPELRVELAPDERQGRGGSATCYFDAGKYQAVFERLNVGQQIVVTGVMNENGALAKCRLLKVDSVAHDK